MFHLGARRFLSTNMANMARSQAPSRWLQWLSWKQAAGSWPMSPWSPAGHLQNEWSQGQSSEIWCYTLLYPIPIPQVHCTCQVSKWWILDRYHVPLGSVGGTQPWRVKMSAMGVAVESREVARNGSSQLARLTWLWTWVGEHPQVIYLDQHFDPHPLCNGRTPPCIERQAGH